MPHDIITCVAQPSVEVNEFDRTWQEGAATYFKPRRLETYNKQMTPNDREISNVNK